MDQEFDDGRFVCREVDTRLCGFLEELQLTDTIVYSIRSSSYLSDSEALGLLKEAAAGADHCFVDLVHVATAGDRKIGVLC